MSSLGIGSVGAVIGTVRPDPVVPRLGLWTHLGTQFCGTVFGLLWGVPYLVAGQGMSAGQVSALLTLLVVVGILAGPLFGEFAARHPMRRSLVVLTVIAAHALVWAAVLLVPPPAPRCLLACSCSCS